MPNDDPLLDAALALLAAEGETALTVRRLAGAVGASTKVIYSRHGSMSGVRRALHARGFAQLYARMATAMAGEVGEGRLRAAADAYRAFANEAPTLFSLMYGDAADRDLPERADREAAAPTLDLLATAFEGEAGGEDPHAAARFFWTQLHGITALEASGWLDENEARAHLARLLGGRRATRLAPAT